METHTGTTILKSDSGRGYGRKMAGIFFGSGGKKNRKV